MGRVLIINVDDIGIYQQAVEPAIEAISEGVAASGSVMVVCPGSGRALGCLAGRPDVPVGVHLTLTRDFPTWPWMPLTSGRSIQQDGLLFTIDQRERLLAQAHIEDVVGEFRGQIEKALGAGVRLTHLDWHCLADGGRPDIFDRTLALAEEYDIGVRAWTEHGRGRLRAQGRAAQDQPFLDSFSAPVVSKTAYLIERLEQLPDGLSEWAMHPAAPNPDDPGTDVRSSDRAALLSEELREAIDRSGITVVGHDDAVWSSRTRQP